MPLYTTNNFRVGQRAIEDLPISGTKAGGAFVSAGLEQRALLGGDRELAGLLALQSEQHSRKDIQGFFEQYIDIEPGTFKVPEAYYKQFATEFYSKDEANERGEVWGLTFDDRTTVAVFDRKVELKREEIKMQNAQNRSSLPMPVEFVAAMLGTLADPLELGLNFVPVPGVNALTRRIGSKVGQRLVRGAAEGFAGSVIVEPLVSFNMTQADADYTMRDSLLNIAMGTAAGSALHVTLGGVGDLYVRRTKRKQLLREASDELARIELAEASAKQDFTLGQRLEAAAPEAEFGRGVPDDEFAGGVREADEFGRGVPDDTFTTAQRLDSASPKTRHAALKATIGQKLDGRISDISEIVEADPGFRNPELTAREIQIENAKKVNTKPAVESINARNANLENMEFVDAESSKRAETDNKSNVDISEPDEMDVRLADDEAVLIKELDALDIADDLRDSLGLEGSARIEGEVSVQSKVPKIIAEATEAVATSRKFADAIRFIGACLGG